MLTVLIIIIEIYFENYRISVFKMTTWFFLNNSFEQLVKEKKNS